jgi:hypothetical protein
VSINISRCSKSGGNGNSGGESMDEDACPLQVVWRARGLPSLTAPDM